MFQNIIHFLKYNNLATLAVAAALVGSGGAFAASPALRAVADDILVGRTEMVVAIDNSAILNADFDNFDPALTITAVAEDADRYLVSYRLATFDVVSGAWQKTERAGALKVAKGALGDLDLRAYVEKELGEVARQETRYLKEIQFVERKKGETEKQVAIAYAGLLGLVIDPKEKEPEARPSVVIQHSVLNKVVESKPAEFQPTAAAVTPSAPANLEVLHPNSDVTIQAEEAVASATPSAIKPIWTPSIQTMTALATTTNPAVLIAPAESLAPATTTPTDIASTTPVM